MYFYKLYKLSMWYEQEQKMKKKILVSEQIYVIDEKVTTEILQWEYEKDN